MLQTVCRLEDALTCPPQQWGPEEYLTVAVNAKRLYLHEFLAHWWTAPPAKRRQVAEAVVRYYSTLRRYGKFRALGLTRSDFALWRTIAGGAVNEEPLDRAVLAPLDG